ncbi:MAG: phosphocholine cytidylyltransferase family protein [Nanoarchaeota archaeon]
MKALILAAGVGKRLHPFTEDIPKCLLKVGEKSILEHLLDSISSSKIKEVILVVGFKKELIYKKIGDSYQGMIINYATNNFFDQTNNLYSLWCARHLIDDAFVQFNGDLIVNREIIKKVFNSHLEDAVVIDSSPNNFVEDANRIRLEKGRVILLNKTISKEESAGRAFGIYKFSKENAQEYCKSIELNIYKFKDGFETGLRPLLGNFFFQIIDINGLPYAEIDDMNDLDSARKKIDYIINYGNFKS